MKIICYARPWNALQFLEIAKGIDSTADIQVLSEHFKVDQTGVSRRYYSALKENIFVNSKSFMGNDRDIILRCRLLRKLERIDALRHLYAMRVAIHEFMDAFNPDIILSLTIDSFVIDCLYEYAQSKSIKFIGLVPSFINGYVRLTVRGEHICLRSPLEHEVDQVLSLLDHQNYQPAFLKNSKKSPFKSSSKRWARNLIKPAYFYAKRHLSGERYNYHYWASEKVSIEWLHFIPVFNIGDASWENIAAKNGKKNIYIPLQMIPEATVDYWCDNLDAVEYESTLYEIIFRLSSDFNFLIKEHPNVLGWRNSKVYRNLKSIKGVTICPSDTPSNEIVEFCDAVFVWTGSVGVEAALRGKPVFTICNAYYLNSRMFKVVNANTPGNDMLNFIKSQSSPLSYDEKRSLVEHVLSGLLGGSLKNDGSWSSADKNDLKDARNMGASISSVLKPNS
jgi:hypothetical protein